MRIKILPDRADDKPLLLVAQLGIDRQRDGFPGGRFRDREIAGLVAQSLEAGLQVQGDRIIDLRADLPCRQVIAQRIAERSGYADDILIVDVEIAFALAR